MHIAETFGNKLLLTKEKIPYHIISRAESVSQSEIDVLPPEYPGIPLTITAIKYKNYKLSAINSHKIHAEGQMCTGLK